MLELMVYSKPKTDKIQKSPQQLAKLSSHSIPQLFLSTEFYIIYLSLRLSSKGQALGHESNFPCICAN